MYCTASCRILGYEADEAADGREALDMWQAGDYATVLADCHMPQMDGYELARRIRVGGIAAPRSSRTSDRRLHGQRGQGLT